MSAGYSLLLAIHIIITALFLVLYWKSRNADTDCAPGKAGLRAPFLKMGNYLYSLIQRPDEYKNSVVFGSFLKKTFHSSRIREDMSLLYPMDDSEKKSRDFIAEKISLFLVVLFAGNLIASFLCVREFTGADLAEGGRLERNAPGRGKLEIDLNAYLEGRKERITVDLRDRQYTREELQAYLNEASTLLDTVIPGENSSLDEVRSPLNLVGRLDKLPFQVSWEFDNYQVLDADGIPREEFIPPTGTLVKLTGVLTCQDFRGEYIRYARLFPRRPEDKTAGDKLLAAIKSADEKSAHESEVILPERLEGKEIKWQEVFHPQGVWLLLLFAGAGILLYFAQDGKLHGRVEERNRELLSDYPKLVYKLSLLMGAGMTVRTSWKRITQGSEKERISQGASKGSYLQEEMKLTLHEMENGLPEQEAYNRFGRRCGLPVYMKFSTLLVQSQKKGSQGMLSAMEEEVRDAFRERKNMARKEGEEAGTKLLFPMAMMLGVVMVIIVVPAFMSFHF